MTVQQIERAYCAGYHPDVKSGKRSEPVVQKEFEATFRQHHETFNNGNADDRVLPDEFMDYCAHVSSSIESDAYFELMMSNSWGLNQAAGGG